MVLALLTPLLQAAPAAGDPIADKRAEATRISRQVQAQSEKLAILTEDYDQAMLHVTDVNTSLTKAKAQLAATDKQADQIRTRLRSASVQAYVHGGSAHTIGLVIGNNFDSSTAQIRQQYVKTVSGEANDALDRLRAVRMQLAEQRAQLDAAKSDAQSALDKANAARSKAAAAQANLQSTLSKVQGELASLVAAEAKRRAAEEARRMQAALAARKAAEQARQSTAAGRSATGGSTSLPAAVGADAAVAEARRQLGKPYRYGAAGPDAFDCSGLTMWSWAHAGKSLPHSSQAQYSATSRVSLNSLQPGDLVFFGSPIHHVGIYVGGGQMIHAPETGGVVEYEGIYRGDLVGAGRVN